jgi:RNA polymerase sigma-70 factor (sigma-E family)
VLGEPGQESRGGDATDRVGRALKVVSIAGEDNFTQFDLSRQRPLLRLAMVLTGEAVRAEEIVAEVLVRVYERWDRISRLDRANAYVRRMIVNEFLSRKRKDGRTVPLADLTAYAEPAADHAAEYAEHDALIGQLATLPPKQRAAVVLRYYEGLADPEIAETLGCGVGAVRSNISRALATLRVSSDRPTGQPAATSRTSWEP